MRWFFGKFMQLKRDREYTTNKKPFLFPKLAALQSRVQTRPKGQSSKLETKSLYIPTQKQIAILQLNKLYSGRSVPKKKKIKAQYFLAKEKTAGAYKTSGKVKQDRRNPAKQVVERRAEPQAWRVRLIERERVEAPIGRWRQEVAGWKETSEASGGAWRRGDQERRAFLWPCLVARIL